MNTNDTSTMCQCGYIRAGLSHQDLCPECGTLKLMKPKLHTKIIQAWRKCNSWMSRTAAIISVLTLIVALLNIVLTIWITATLLGGVFGGTAGMAILIPSYIWFVVQIPLLFAFGFILLINFFSKADDNTLQQYSAKLMATSILAPVFIYFPCLAIVLTYA